MKLAYNNFAVLQMSVPDFPKKYLIKQGNIGDGMTDRFAKAIRKIQWNGYRESGVLFD